MKKIPNLPERVDRMYAIYKIDSISTLGLMTLKMNETVIVHEDYSDLTVQDFDIIYEKNSDEEMQPM